MSELTHREEITIRRPPADVYAMVADVTRMGEWSPECTSCVWEADERGEGAFFLGTNEREGSDDWTTRCQVVAAAPPSEFAFVVEVTGVRWGYTCEPVEGGTRVTETWTFPPRSREIFEGWYGEKAAAEIERREKQAKAGITATLAALKSAAETTA